MLARAMYRAWSRPARRRLSPASPGVPRSLSTGRSSNGDSSGSDLQPRIQDVTQPVAEQVHAEHREHDAEPREGRDPPRLAQVVAALAQHAAPLRLRRLAAETEKTERGGGQDGGAEAEGGGHDERRDDVGEDVAGQDRDLSLIHISEPTRLLSISYAVF